MLPLSAFLVVGTLALRLVLAGVLVGHGSASPAAGASGAAPQLDRRDQVGHNDTARYDDSGRAIGTARRADLVGEAGKLSSRRFSLSCCSVPARAFTAARPAGEPQG